ncbi:MAG: hypothetical protein ACK4GB_06780, partial [Tepidimonas sp.]
MSERLTPFAAFLRHRYRVHVQGWLMLGVAGLAGYYVSLFPHEPLWLLMPVAFIVAFFVVAIGVVVAALLVASLMFGRTRRKEAERFTQSVIAMRTEARSLETLLQILSQRINDSRSELTMIAQHLMQLGDETTGKLGTITADLDAS